jgi:hypothetical protein
MAYVPASRDKTHQPRPRITTDHGEIRKWIEHRGGRPARVRGNLDEDAVGLLRIDLPGTGHREHLEPITWDEFFRKFEDRDLALLYRQEPMDSPDSGFHKLVHRGNLHPA